MQTLMFNSTIKRVQLWEGSRGNSKLIETFDDVLTVKIETGYYEVMQKIETGVVPVLRVPIANTNMFIEK